MPYSECTTRDSGRARTDKTTSKWVSSPQPDPSSTVQPEDEISISGHRTTTWPAC